MIQLLFNTFGAWGKPFTIQNLIQLTCTVSRCLKRRIGTIICSLLLHSYIFTQKWCLNITSTPFVGKTEKALVHMWMQNSWTKLFVYKSYQGRKLDCFVYWLPGIWTLYFLSELMYQWITKMALCHDYWISNSSPDLSQQLIKLLGIRTKRNFSKDIGHYGYCSVDKMLDSDVGSHVLEMQHRINQQWRGCCRSRTQALRKLKQEGQKFKPLLWYLEILKPI